MDVAVTVVQAYLRVNGSCTVAEYPVLDAAHEPGRTMTDLDILAVRLHRSVGATAAVDATLDPALGAVPGAADMIVGEVKEGRPHPNPAMHDPAVLTTALTRFGCCRAADGAGPGGRTAAHRPLALRKKARRTGTSPDRDGASIMNTTGITAHADRRRPDIQEQSPKSRKEL